MTAGQAEERASALIARAAVLRLADDEGRLPQWVADLIADTDALLASMGDSRDETGLTA